jgi:hypothetical protein
MTNTQIIFEYIRGLLVCVNLAAFIAFWRIGCRTSASSKLRLTFRVLLAGCGANILMDALQFILESLEFILEFLESMLIREEFVNYFANLQWISESLYAFLRGGYASLAYCIMQWGRLAGYLLIVTAAFLGWRVKRSECGASQ